MGGKGSAEHYALLLWWGEVLRSSGWGKSASSSASEAPGWAGWRWLCGWWPCAGPGGGCSWDRVPDAAEGDPDVLVDGGSHIGGGWLSLVGSLLHDDHHSFAEGCWLHTHCLAVNQPIVAEGVVGLQITGFGAVRPLVPFD